MGPGYAPALHDCVRTQFCPDCGKMINQSSRNLTLPLILGPWLPDEMVYYSGLGTDTLYPQYLLFN